MAKQILAALRLDRPDFSFSKGLLEVRKIREGSHCFYAGSRELIAGGIEIELRFEMMHASVQKRFAVQLAPQADGA